MGVDLRAGLMFKTAMEIKSWGPGYRPQRGLSYWTLCRRIMRVVAGNETPARVAQRRREHARRSRKQRVR